jgi:long-subunit fatty acid transport protein
MRPAGRILILVSAALPALLPAAARAGGYDTPMLYSARHMGMGGTAIGYVDEPSAIFHNPAGLAHTPTLSVTGDVSLLLAKVRSTPNVTQQDLTSEQTVAPLGLLGGGLRLNEIVTVGLGVYPIALAGAKYKYTTGVEDRTTLAFIEASPAVALNLPGNVRLGAGYRVTYTSVRRFQGTPDEPFLDFKMDGVNWLGFRVGAQWTPVRWLQLGGVYRHKTKTKVTNDRGIAGRVFDEMAMKLVPNVFADIETTFVLPSKAGMGARADFWHLSVALDGEYLFNSQNGGYPLEGLPLIPSGSPRTAVANVFEWKDEVTVRAGLELRMGFVPAIQRLALRGGYIYDGKTTNPHYPSPFGTPPGPTQVITTGLGWKGEGWQVNAAFARRFGTGEVTAAEVNDPANKPCTFCGKAGALPYKIGVTGLYLDFSYAY